MSQEQFSDYVMICNSTGIQTVNLLPILQFQCSKAVILSTQFTEEKGITQRLIDIFKNKNITIEKIIIDQIREKNLNKLTDMLIKVSKKHNNRIVWNISGGQKMPSAAMLVAFQKRIAEGFEGDIVAYVEANPPEIWHFGQDYESNKIRTSVSLSLSDILYLANFETMKDEDKLYPDTDELTADNIKIGKDALKYFRGNEFFREAFFSYMKPSTTNIRTRTDIEKIVKQILNSVKPRLNEIKVSKKGYEKLEDKISHIFSNLPNAKSKEDIENLIGQLKLIQKPSEIYDDYWNGIKKTVVSEVIKKIESNEVRLINGKIDKVQIAELIRQINSIGGKSDYESGILYKKNIQAFSSIKGNGILFEWMVAAALLEAISSNNQLKESISEIYHGVKTKKMNSTERPDAEHDIVIVTKFGTLILIELKTYEFSGDLAQAQDGLAYKKSGPYGTAMIIGPLLSDMVKIKNEQKEFPAYIDGPIKTQEDTASQNNTEYYYLDGMTDMLKKKLYLK